MDTTDIPKSVNVAGTLFDAVYTSTKDPNAETWSWYPPQQRRDTWPHLTVGMGDEIDGDIKTRGQDDKPYSLRKVWWYKLHVSVNINGRNLQMFYRVNSDWSVAPCGNSIKHIPSYGQNEAQGHLNRQATDYKAFAEAFIQSARNAWMATVTTRGAPKVTNVGPQTARAFARGDGL